MAFLLTRVLLKRRHQLMLCIVPLIFIVYYLIQSPTPVEIDFARLQEHHPKQSKFHQETYVSPHKVTITVRVTPKQEHVTTAKAAAVTSKIHSEKTAGTPTLINAHRDTINRHIESELEEALKEEEGTGCDIPKTDPFAKEVMKFDKKYPPITCKGRDWVKCYLSKCKVDPMVLKYVKRLECQYKDIIYESDNSYKRGPKRVFKGDHEYSLNVSDHVDIRCTGVEDKNSTFSFGSRWRGHGAAYRPIRPNKPPPGRENTYNVLIFGFDSTSKNLFIRKMPKSYRFLQDELKPVILNGYNIVGDGTPASLFPILTGKTELELPECRKSIKGSGHLDSMPFIFYKLKEDGYRTAYFEDMPWIGTFQYRFNGFLHQPADHYLRDFYLEVTKYNAEIGVPRHTFCVGDTPRYQLMMNLTDQFFRLDGKKYAFTFIADITHDDANYLGTADEAFVEFMRGLVKGGVLNDTLVMLMGDHGPRFADFRATLQGKLEERLPLMAIRLPDSFIAKRPDALAALEHNAEVLTTPHDIYATVLDLLDMTQHWNGYKVKGAHLTRGLTLLKPIPRNRSCSEAGIERHWCACLKWEELKSSDPLYNRAAQALVDQINSMTEFAKKLCARRTLTAISWVMRKQPNQRMLSFKHAKDGDGYIGAFGGTTHTEKQTYQVKIEVGPGKGVYEAAVTHLLKSDKLVISTREISRTNRYNDEPSCISATYPHLNPYCYCIS